MSNEVEIESRTGKEKAGASSRKEHIRGVFSSQEIRTIGTGTTQRRSVQKVFWFIEQDEKGQIEVQPLNTNYVPTGTKKRISMEELLEKYAPEPEFYVQSVFPKMQELNESVERGDHCRDKGENFSAEFEYKNALNLDVENVKANFGIGLTYLARGEADKADNIFERLVHLDAAFQEEHKHLFNDFGISLRKNKMYNQAKEYYTRALELSEVDENLHINIARTLMEIQEYLPCTQHLFEALRLSPGNETALKFLGWLQEKGLIPEELRKDAAAALKGQLQDVPKMEDNEINESEAALDFQKNTSDFLNDLSSSEEEKGDSAPKTV